MRSLPKSTELDYESWIRRNFVAPRRMTQPLKAKRWCDLRWFAKKREKFLSKLKLITSQRCPWVTTSRDDWIVSYFVRKMNCFEVRTKPERDLEVCFAAPSGVCRLYNVTWRLSEKLVLCSQHFHWQLVVMIFLNDPQAMPCTATTYDCENILCHLNGAIFRSNRDKWWTVKVKSFSNVRRVRHSRETKVECIRKSRVSACKEIIVCSGGWTNSKHRKTTTRRKMIIRLKKIKHKTVKYINGSQLKRQSTRQRPLQHSFIR